MNRKDRSMVNNIATVGGRSDATSCLRHRHRRAGRSVGTGPSMDTLPHWPGLRSRLDATLTAAADTAFGALDHLTQHSFRSPCSLAHLRTVNSPVGYGGTWLVTPRGRLVLPRHSLVKTNIRERGARWRIATTVFHGVGMVFVVAPRGHRPVLVVAGALAVIIFLRALARADLRPAKDGSSQGDRNRRVVVSIALVFHDLSGTFCRKRTT